MAVKQPRNITERQLEVLRFVGQGLSNRSIAGRLRVSEAAVKKHVSSLLLRFRVRNRAGLVRAIGVARRDEEIAQFFRWAPFMAVMTRGPEHVVEFANERLLDYIGRRPILGRPTRQANPELARHGVSEVLDRVYASGQPYSARGFVIRADLRGDGHVEERVIDLLVYPRRDVERRVEGLIAVGIDLTGATPRRPRRDAGRR